MGTNTKKLSVFSKLFYGMGDMSGTFAGTVIGIFYLIYLTDVVLLRPILAGTALLVGKLWDAVTDPYMGHLSDRIKTRWGRRRVFFLIVFIPLGASFFLLWATPNAETVGQAWAFVYAMLTYMLFMTAWTVYAVPYQALTAEMTSDYDERTSLSSYRMAVSILGGLAAALVPYMIFDAVQGAARGHLIMGMVFGVLIALGPLFPLIGCREEDEPRQASFPFFKGIALVWKNHNFRYVLGMFLVTWTAIDLLQSIFLYFLQYWLKIDPNSQSSLGIGQGEMIFGILFIVAALMLPLWVWVSGRLGKRKAYIIGVGFFGVVLTALTFFSPEMPGLTGSVYIMCVLAGVGLSAAHVMPFSIIPDCIEYDELLTGKRREGLYYGFTTFIQKCAVALALWLSGMLLEVTGYVPNAPQQADSALFAIRMLFGPVPFALILIGCCCMARYKIDRDAFDAIKAQIREKRQTEV